MKSAFLSIIRGDSFKTVANKLYKAPQLRKELLQCVARSAKMESKVMCKSVNPSILRKTSPADLQKLSLEEISKDIREKNANTSCYTSQMCYEEPGC